MCTSVLELMPPCIFVTTILCQYAWMEIVNVGDLDQDIAFMLLCLYAAMPQWRSSMSAIFAWTSHSCYHVFMLLCLSGDRQRRQSVLGHRIPWARLRNAHDFCQGCVCVEYIELHIHVVPSRVRPRDVSEMLQDW